jgi:DNA repair protein RecN (Recombination protein N)
MLKLLSIKNLAVVDQLQMEFGEGLNVLTGETGSGKSIIIDALDLLLGGRSSLDLIRTGAEKASVEGIFAANPHLAQQFEDAGIDFDENEIIVRREIAATGRSRVYVNNQAATTAFLKSIQPAVLDIHGQGEQQSLVIPSTQLALLDLFAGTSDKRTVVEEIYGLIAKVIDDIESQVSAASNRQAELEMMRARLEEIGGAQIKPDEAAELLAERTMLANADRLARLCGDSYGSLYENEASAASIVAVVSRFIDELSTIDSRFEPISNQLQSVRFSLEEIAFFLRGYIANIQASPDRLAFVDGRLAQIERLRRKYDLNPADIEKYLQDLESRVLELEDGGESLPRLTSRLLERLASYQAEARELTKLRREAARRFEKVLQKEFASVALDKAKFEIRFNLPEGVLRVERMAAICEALPSIPVSRTGAESIQFFFSANPGEELRSLSGVASGGELSRLMLLIKNVVAPTTYPRTLIFDEVDQGIGGRVADAVGLRLHRLARSNQVLCVTHQPQIARYADAHFLIEKAVTESRTRTRATQLDEGGRVDELARMLAGAEVTAAARKHARELIRTKNQIESQK